MPEASIYEEVPHDQTMPMSLAMKRPAEGGDLAPPSPNTDIQKSPIKMLNNSTLRPPLAKKQRCDDSIGDSVGIGSEASGSPLPESATDSDIIEDEEDESLGPPRPFPCVWLNGCNGLPLTEEPTDHLGYKPPPEPIRIEPITNGIADSLGELDIVRNEEAHEHIENGGRSSIENSPYHSGSASSPNPESATDKNSTEPSGETEDSQQESRSSFQAPSPMQQNQNTEYRAPQLPGTPTLPTGPTPAMSPSTMFPNVTSTLTPGSIPPSPRTPTSGPNSPMMKPFLNNEVQIGPDGMPMEVCPECHKVFKRKVYLQRHMEREHWSTAKVFKCDDCSYETKHQSNLSVHRRIHTGERPYHCGVCGQRYTQGHLLKSHIRSRHGGNMEYYNLDKKSDSTRGRKSLDIKHDAMGHPSLQKSDSKINHLVQQLENQHKMASNPMMPPSMSQFMSSMSYINSLRPLMANPLALSAGAMMAPRFFGMQNGMCNNMVLGPSGLPMLPPPMGPAGLNHMMENGGPKITELPNGKVSLKLSEMNTGYIRDGSPTSISPKPKLSPRQEENGTLDLTTKKAVKEEPKINGSASMMNGMVLNCNTTSPVSQLSSPNGAVNLTGNNMHTSPGSPKMHLSPNHLNMHHSPRQPSPTDIQTSPNSNPPMQTSPKNLSNPLSNPPMMNPHHMSSLINGSPKMMEKFLESQQRNQPMPPLMYFGDSPSKVDMLLKGGPKYPSLEELAYHTEIGLMKKRQQCDDIFCTHANKLKNLRRNIVRMLSVLTPDLSIENGLDYNSDQVDELLHDVIYSSLDDALEESTRKT